MAENKEEINVVLTRVKPSVEWPDGVKFELNSAIGSGDKLTFKNNGKDGFKIRFQIVDDDQTGYLFPDDEDAAMWARPVNAITDPCPTTAEYWPTFYATGVTDSNKTLKVTNSNDRPQLFKFTLLFTKTPDQNGPCIQFDPIGDNRNGPTFVRSNLAIAIGVVAIVLIAAFAFFRLRDG